MINFTNNKDEYLWRGVMYASIMMLVKVGKLFFQQHTQYFFHKLHVNLVCTMQSAIFKKVTKYIEYITQIVTHLSQIFGPVQQQQWTGRRKKCVFNP